MNISHRMFAMIIAGMCLTARAQTNSFSQCSHWLVLPDLHLRGESTEPAAIGQTEHPISARSDSPVTKLGVTQIKRTFSTALNADHDDLDPQWFQRVEPDLILTKPTHNNESFLSRSFTSIFQPEEFYVGETTVSCSIWTAIKHKNPLCLINPIFLNVSW